MDETVLPLLVESPVTPIRGRVEGNCKDRCFACTVCLHNRVCYDREEWLPRDGA